MNVKATHEFTKLNDVIAIALHEALLYSIGNLHNITFLHKNSCNI